MASAPPADALDLTIDHLIERRASAPPMDLDDPPRETPATPTAAPALRTDAPATETPPGSVAPEVIPERAPQNYFENEWRNHNQSIGSKYSYGEESLPLYPARGRHIHDIKANFFPN